MRSMSVVGVWVFEFLANYRLLVNYYLINSGAGSLSGQTFARLAVMWSFSKRRVYCEPAIARIRDTEGSRSSKLLRGI
jgi:hypothetical protein